MQMMRRRPQPEGLTTVAGRYRRRASSTMSPHRLLLAPPISARKRGQRRGSDLFRASLVPGQLDLRFLVARAIQDRGLPDRRGDLRIRRGRQALRELMPLFSALGLDPHFDQFVRDERPLRFGDHRITHVAFTDANNRRERVRKTFEELTLFRRERHRAAMVADMQSRLDGGHEMGRYLLGIIGAIVLAATAAGAQTTQSFSIGPRVSSFSTDIDAASESLKVGRDNGFGLVGDYRINRF